MLSTGMLVQNRYRIVEKLGSGGFSEVFAVRDEKYCHQVQVIKVLKVLNLENFPASEKDKAIALFQREAQVLSKLNHPGIPKVEPPGYFTIENDRKTIHCLVMEKIIGENLLNWLEQRDRQPIASSLAIDWLKQLLEILQELHQNHYFHRDIKPENIMLQPNGKLVLIDFGGVRQINNTYLVKLGEDREHTRLMSPEGYTPIEQMNGKAVPQSDFFALGRTMVHLLTGIVPINLPENETTGDLIWRDRASEIPDKLADLLDEMMALFPRERPSSTEVILSRLNDLESVESVESFKSGDSAGKIIPFKNIITEKLIKKKGAIAFSSDGRILVSGGADSAIMIWDWRAEKRLRTLNRPDDFFGSLASWFDQSKGIIWASAISPDDKIIASGGSDQPIYLWNLETGKLEKSLTDHEGYVCCLAFSPDRQTLASGGKDNTIRIWNYHTGELRQTLNHLGTVKSLAFSPDGQTLVSGGWDRTVKIWHFA